MQAIYKRRGLQEKSGLAARERKEAHPELVSLTSTTQQGAGQMSGGHSASAGDFLEKELHRRYSKRELHNNKSVPYQKSQGCHVLFKKKKNDKAQNLNPTFLQLNCSKDSRWMTLPLQHDCWGVFSDKHWCLLYKAQRGRSPTCFTSTLNSTHTTP